MESKEQQIILPEGIKTESPGTLKKFGEQPWQEWVEPVVEVIEQVPDYIGQFVSNYSKLLVVLGTVFLGIVSVRIVIALLDAIDDIPLLAPILELVGLCYTGWFVYRYLWKAENRQELVAEYEALRKQILGNNRI